MYYSGYHKVAREGWPKNTWRIDRKRNVDNGLQIQLEENEGGSARQS